LEDGTKVRVSRKTGALIPWPDRSEWDPEVRYKDVNDGIKDTPAEIVLKQTYFGEDYEAIRKRFEEYIREQEADAKWLVFKS